MRKYLTLLILASTLISCSTQSKILYFQNLSTDTPTQIIQGGDITLKKGDIISIFVSSKNPELSSVFNLTKPTSSSSTDNTIDYTIDSYGEIDFPILGNIKVEGMSKTQLTREIKQRILDSGMLPDPVVSIEFKNLYFYTLGEFNSPGSYKLEKEKTSILDAISMSGDMTINALRDRIFLTRKVGDKAITYKLDITTTDIYNSPAYYIQQNDLIYVEPNKPRSDQSTTNGNTIRKVSFWTSIASFFTSIALLVLNL